jgi:hypothetical protein
VCGTGLIWWARIGSRGNKIQKSASLQTCANGALVPAGACPSEYDTCSGCKADHSQRCAKYACPRMARPTFDGPFSESSSIIAKRHTGGFDALHDCAQRSKCRCDKKTLRLSAGTARSATVTLCMTAGCRGIKGGGRDLHGMRRSDVGHHVVAAPGSGTRKPSRTAKFPARKFENVCRFATTLPEYGNGPSIFGRAIRTHRYPSER